MFYGKVVGTVTATVKDEKLVGHKLLVVQPVNYDQESEGELFVAIDHATAGLGDFVYMAKGKDAGWPIGRDTAVDIGIMGIVEIVSVDPKYRPQEKEG
jgi:microcompartment protein CcmK/EutM